MNYVLNCVSIIDQPVPLFAVNHRQVYAVFLNVYISYVTRNPWKRRGVCERWNEVV